MGEARRFKSSTNHATDTIMRPVHPGEILFTEFLEQLA
jgi:hypothetical protein